MSIKKNTIVKYSREFYFFKFTINKSIACITMKEGEFSKKKITVFKTTFYYICVCKNPFIEGRIFIKYMF